MVHPLFGWAPAVGKEVTEERCVVSTENLLVKLPRSRHENGPRLVKRSHSVLMEVSDHLMQAVGQPFGAEQHRGELSEQQVKEASLPEMPRLDIRRREDRGVNTVAPVPVQDAERFQASGVEVELMT